MEEKRRFSRWNMDDKAYIDVEGKKEEVRILDVSIGGMHIITNSPLDRESTLTGEFKVIPNIGPFFVKGKVTWTAQKDNAFESGIEFEKVSTIPLAG